ncbi:MAG: hypothetical protein G01um101438_870 [Parcubacteria group bacterium Gr01-1014_38]|nr:MAG: hypothetical protein G01um101438_870 [Parcubacteria group bacterium Gr01-1014_38]
MCGTEYPEGLRVDFFRFHARLLREFPESYSLMRRVLQRVPTLDDQAMLDELGRMAEQACPLIDRSGLPADAFQRVVLHAITFVRGAAINLYRQGDNPEGFILELRQEIARWTRAPEYMRNIVSS